jgi:hypothetical protein
MVTTTGIALSRVLARFTAALALLPGRQLFRALHVRQSGLLLHGLSFVQASQDLYPGQRFAT